jgi:hypothetical protein
MPSLTNLTPFESAIQALARRGVLPTNLSSAELAQLGAAFHRQNFTSARTLLTDLLAAYKEKVASILNPQTELRDGRPVTTGLDPATARFEIKQLQGSDGSGGLTDLGSDQRINLVLKTNTELAQGAGRFIQSNAPGAVDAFPAQELVRYDQKEKPRDWPQRWRIAAQVAGDVDAARVLDSSGRMVALLSSEIWQQLGEGAGGYDDTLGNPYPPFAFNSGMWVEAVSRAEAVALGLMQEDDVAEPAALDLNSIFSTSA